MISRAEGNYAEASEALAEIYKHTGKAHIIGITGVPGAGKSTLVASLIKALTWKVTKSAWWRSIPAVHFRAAPSSAIECA